jgi:curli biogenesis system outer membrane secretion channel CsgG
MKKILCIISFILAIHGFSQNAKTTIAILPFHTDFSYGREYINQISEMISQAFVSSGRFSLYDPDRLQQVLIDSNLVNLPVDPASENSYRNIGKSLGIQYFLSGNVKNISTKSVTNISGSDSYTGHIIFTLKIVNVETGEIGDLKEFDSYGAVGGFINMSYDTEHNALLKTIQSMKHAVEKFIGESLPVTFPVMSILQQKNGEASAIEILGGKNLGLVKNTKLTVQEITYRMYEGRSIRKIRNIGIVKISDVLGDDISEAKVLEGGKDILRAFQADPKSILCKAD